MYVLKELVKGILIGPTLWVILMVVTFVVWKRRWARRALLALILIFLLVHSSPVSYLSTYLLESEYHPLNDPHNAAPYDAIVVLTGGSVAATGLIPYPSVNWAMFRRLEEAWRLYKIDPKPVIVSGGHSNPFIPVRGENGVACDYLVRWGVPAEQVIGEGNSRDTFESAVEVAKILRQRGWKRYLLVTSALHMPRSRMVFAAIAPEPIPAPGDFRSHLFELTPLTLLPSEGAAETNYLALHEYVGWLQYRLRLAGRN